MSTTPLPTAPGADCAGPSPARVTDGWLAAIGYLATGMVLGIVFMRSEVLSWYRIQEMFRFQSPHMFGIIGVAVAVATTSRWLIARLGARALTGQPIDLTTPFSTRPSARHALGGLVFGLGWALLGACPGPIFTLIGAGHSVYVVALVSAVAGTWLYALLQQRLPH